MVGAELGQGSSGFLFFFGRLSTTKQSRLQKQKFNKKPQKWVKLHGLIWMSFPIPRKGITLLEYRAIFSTSYLSVKITLRFRWQHTEDIYHLFRIVVAFSGYGLRFYA